MEVFSAFDFSALIPTVIKYGSLFVSAIVLYFLGSFAISKIVFALEKVIISQKFDETLSRFLLSFAGGVLRVMLIFSVIGYLGIEITSFIAIFGAASLAIGMALSGTLQNFAGGVMLLLFKPYKVGDFIEFAGFSGKVKEIQIFNTILLTSDNKTIIIPNSECSTSALINYSKEGTRRVDFVFGIGYNDDIDTAKKVLQEEFEKHPFVLDHEEIKIVISNLGASSVDISVRVWCESAHYWDVYFEMTETIKKAFDSKGISFPFPQQEVTLIQK